jgi:hypothetical protein
MVYFRLTSVVKSVHGTEREEVPTPQARGQGAAQDAGAHRDTVRSGPLPSSTHRLRQLSRPRRVPVLGLPGTGSGPRERVAEAEPAPSQAGGIAVDVGRSVPWSPTPHRDGGSRVPSEPRRGFVPGSHAELLRPDQRLLDPCQRDSREARLEDGMAYPPRHPKGRRRTNN